VSVLPFGGSGEAADILLVTAFDVPPEPTSPSSGQGTRRVQVATVAFDTAWRAAGDIRRTVEVPVGFHEVFSHFRLPAGRYEVRVAAEIGGLAGGLFAAIDVPRFDREPLALSGVAVGCTAGLPHVSDTILDDLGLPIVPTTARAFSASDRVTAFLRVYQGGSGMLKPVTMTAQVVDSRDQTAIRQVTTVTPEEFGKRRSADYSFVLPTSRLSPGEHLLTIDATLERRHQARAVRFTIR
jgi:hypothetical protein